MSVTIPWFLVSLIGAAMLRSEMIVGARLFRDTRTAFVEPGTHNINENGPLHNFKACHSSMKYVFVTCDYAHAMNTLEFS